MGGKNKINLEIWLSTNLIKEEYLQSHLVTNLAPGGNIIVKFHKDKVVSLTDLFWKIFEEIIVTTKPPKFCAQNSQSFVHKTPKVLCMVSSHRQNLIAVSFIQTQWVQEPYHCYYPVCCLCLAFIPL